MALESGEGTAGAAEDEQRQQSRVSFLLTAVPEAAAASAAPGSRVATAKSAGRASERTSAMSLRSRSAGGRASRQQKIVSFEIDRQPGDNEEEVHETEDGVLPETDAEADAELHAAIDDSAAGSSAGTLYSCILPLALWFSSNNVI